MSNINDENDFFSDFESDFDPEKYKEYLKKIYNELTGQDINEDDDFLSLDTSNSQYMQDLSNEEQQEIFEDFISTRNMELSINFTEIDGQIMIEEMWNSNDDGIFLKRMYIYDHKTISKLDHNIQRKIYEVKLPELVENEEFEEAAKVRDFLSDLD